MEDHFIYVRGYPEAIPISAQEKEQVRKGMVGEQALADLSLIIQNKTLCAGETGRRLNGESPSW